MLTYPKPSSELSNSTNAGVTADPCSRMSWGVVMETRHLTRVRGTVLSSAERTRLRLMRYWPLSSAGVVKTLSGPKPSMDRVMLSVKPERTTGQSAAYKGRLNDLRSLHWFLKKKNPWLKLKQFICFSFSFQALSILTAQDVCLLFKLSSLQKCDSKVITPTIHYS